MSSQNILYYVMIHSRIYILNLTAQYQVRFKIRWYPFHLQVSLLLGSFSVKKIDLSFLTESHITYFEILQSLKYNHQQQSNTITCYPLRKVIRPLKVVSKIGKRPSLQSLAQQSSLTEVCFLCTKLVAN